MTAENTQDNRDELIEEVIEIWNMDELLGYAKQQLNKEYKVSTELFEQDWESTFPSEEL